MLALENLLACKASRKNHLSKHPVQASVGAGGIIVLVLAAIGVYMMLPEIRRYLRIERM